MSVTSDSTYEVDVPDFEEKQLLMQGSEPYGRKRSTVASSKGRWILFFSFALNLFCISKFVVDHYVSESALITRFAHLKRDKPIPFMTAEQNESLPDAVWDSWDVDTGTIALDDTYVKAMGLPLAQRWPWDFSKGIYYIQAYHQMHCIKMLRMSIREFRAGELQSEHPSHIDHCLTGLVEQIVCNADDTPRYTGGHFKHPASGTGQTRQCRDWNKLEAWAKQNTACYKEPEDTYDSEHILERYMNCPDGSRPWEGAEIWEMENSKERGGLWLEKEPKFDN